MTVHASIREGDSATRTTTRDLDNMDVERIARGVVAYHPSVNMIRPLLDHARLEIPGLATDETVLSIYYHNPDCLFALARTDSAPDAWLEPTGFIAQLPLNEAGAEALFSGRLDTAAPDLDFICRQHERPKAIYIWCIFVNHRLSGGIALIMERLSSAKNRAAPLYCKATSEKSRTFFLSLGFKAGTLWRGQFIPDLMEYRRSLLRTGEDAASEATHQVGSPAPACGDRLAVQVVHSIDDLMKVFAVRSATYIAEHQCPYDEEYDGNDFTATHLLGTVNGEPAGCIRIRYFAGFAKLERLAVVDRFRRTRLARELIATAIAFCRQKGYRRLYGHAETRVVRLWQRFGFQPRTDRPTFAFSDRLYVEGDLELDGDPKALTPDSSPYVLIRPEGQWDEPGILEHSSRRSL